MRDALRKAGVGGTDKDWTNLVRRCVDMTAVPDRRKMILGIVQHAFNTEVPCTQGKAPKIEVTREQLAAIALEAATGKTDGIDTVCKANGISARTFWRYFVNLTLPELAQQIRVVFHRIFLLARLRFGLMRQFEIYIDETQTLFFGRVRKMVKRKGDRIPQVSIDDGKLTEVGLLAGGSKDDKYSGKFWALTYQVMVAKCRRTGIIIPLDTVLVATNHPLIVGDIFVPGRSKEWIIAHFIGLLDAAYPPCKIILFDRGYHAKVNYTRVTDYCTKHGAYYMTPAFREAAPGLKDKAGKSYSSIDNFLLENRATAKPVKRGSTTLYAIGYNPVPYSNTVRTLLAFYRLREARGGADEGAPAVAIDIDSDYVGCAFYVNHPNPEPLIQWWERVYSRRWGEENWFKKRNSQCKSGRAFLAVRRQFIFTIGCIVLAIYALLRGIICPRIDAAWVSRNYSWPQFVLKLGKPGD